MAANLVFHNVLLSSRSVYKHFENPMDFLYTQKEPQQHDLKPN